jgi:rhodanese-related sulfurtransferase
MKKYFFILVTVVCVAYTSCAQTSNTKVITNLSAERFQAAANGDKSGVIIDLRTPEEIKKGYIKGATFIDFLAKDSEKQIDKLDKKKTYYVYCAGGGRSADCAEYMEKHGFTRVYNLEKGFGDWAKKGLPVEIK